LDLAQVKGAKLDMNPALHLLQDQGRRKRHSRPASTLKAHLVCCSHRCQQDSRCNPSSPI
jgi:hypothetical protein